jgi:hypothetical protein
MKYLSLLLFLALTNNTFGQDFFKKAKPGLSITGFYNTTGKYVYILRQDAKVNEVRENRAGAMLSAILLFPLNTDQDFNLVINLPVADVAKTVNFFNSQTPIGVGLAGFPFEEAQFLGITAMCNFGTVDRLRKQARDDQYYPLNIYPDVIVNAPVPQHILDPYQKKEFSLAINIGIIIRAWDGKK